MHLLPNQGQWWSAPKKTEDQRKLVIQVANYAPSPCALSKTALTHPCGARTARTCGSDGTGAACTAGISRKILAHRPAGQSRDMSTIRTYTLQDERLAQQLNTAPTTTDLALDLDDRSGVFAVRRVIFRHPVLSHAV